MNRDQAREIILSCGQIRGGDWVTSSDVAAMLDCTTSMATQILRRMAGEGVLKMYRHISARNVTVRYSKAAKGWASVPWRKRSNSALGLDAYPEIMRAAL